MYVDYQNEFSDAQVVIASCLSTHKVDVGVNAGAGEPIQTIGVVSSGFCNNAAVNGVLTIQLWDSEESTFLVGATSLLWSVGPIPDASMTTGFDLGLPNVPTAHERYLALAYVLADGSALVGGAIDSFLGLDKQTNKAEMGRPDLA